MRDNNEGGTPKGGLARSPAAKAEAPAPTSGQRPFGADPERGIEDDSLSSRLASTDMHQFIGRQLRAVFDDVARQPVPDRFLELMKQLDTKTGTR